MAEPIRVVCTVTGADRPGVTATLFEALTAYESERVEVRDVEQVVLRGKLVLGVSLAVHGDAGALAGHLHKTCGRLGLTAEVLIGGPATPSVEQPRRQHVILLGRPLTAPAMAGAAARIAELGGNIDRITRLSKYPVTSLELIVSGVDGPHLRAALAESAKATGTDLAVEPAGWARRATRLVVFDVDSTLITGEVIEMLAEYAGRREEVAKVTEQAMRGELDFGASLKARVAELKGLDASVIDAVRHDLQLTPGARTLVRTLKRMGYLCGVVSGGFTQVTDQLVADLGLDFSAANTLEIVDGRLTGEVVGEIVDRPGKATALRNFAEKAGIPMSQTVAVGDGANDIDMISAAGLGIAFNAKPALRAVADTSLNQPYLDAILFFLGISRDEVEEADAGS
ncbi:phosphoserine phosphatase SerB [Fodinicola feengrottensis]|uniref:phosphoserine phosphatase SerB n=1 Tax=Fodinicola feengrottensis TaxID=435914 RepID=UPI0013D442CE|nr:phosphoserine phosphatase SerB [Fodinicola feengrottensis]